MDDKIKGLIYGSLIGDALSLCAHWIYNPLKIKRLYDRVTEYLPPIPTSFHGSKTKGDLTHYGDQTLVLLESITRCGSFNAEDFAKRWRVLFTDYDGYIDQATRDTCIRLEAGIQFEEGGSSSNDLGGAARIAPLFLLYETGNPDRLFDAARAQTKFTHNDPSVIDASVFFARVVMEVLQGESVHSAIKIAINFKYSSLPVRIWYQRTCKYLEHDLNLSVKDLGRTCHLEDAFPSTLLFLLRYTDDLENALIDNVMAGGDSAARGLILGMILGAQAGYSSIPERWVEGLNAFSTIKSLTNGETKCES